MSFNEFNIFFKYRGLDQFDSPENVYFQERDALGYCQDIVPLEIDANGYNTIDDLCQLQDLKGFANSNGFMPDNYINVLIPFETIGFSGAGFYGNPSIVMTRSHFNKKTFIHEMGHVLYLDHPHANYIDYENPSNQYYTACEHVSRIEGEGDYNAKVAGDKIIDTNASPDFRNEDYYNLLAEGYSIEYAEEFNIKYLYLSEDCDYTGEGTDCIETPYSISLSDTKNIMAYTLQVCRETFTIGQAIRMHEIVELDPGTFESRETNLSALFEPYKGEYYIAGPLPEHYQAPLFQPGFEYKFIECSGDFSSPSDYGISFSYDINTVLLQIDNDETNYPSITHPNHSAIYINHSFGDFFDDPEKCYNNWNRKPNGGSITKFNDDIFNTNVTITPQDSTSINNQNLFEN